MKKIRISDVTMKQAAEGFVRGLGADGKPKFEALLTFGK